MGGAVTTGGLIFFGFDAATVGGGDCGALLQPATISASPADTSTAADKFFAKGTRGKRMLIKMRLRPCAVQGLSLIGMWLAVR
jgi:hypothetical protein